MGLSAMIWLHFVKFAMATNDMVKIGKIGLFAFIRSPSFGNGLQYRHPDFWKVYLWWSGYTVCKFNELPVTPGVKRVVGVHPVR